MFIITLASSLGPKSGLVNSMLCVSLVLSAQIPGYLGKGFIQLKARDLGEEKAWDT